MTEGINALTKRINAMKHTFAVEGAHSFCGVIDGRTIAAVVMWPYGEDPDTTTSTWGLVRFRLCAPEQLAVYMGGRHDRG